MTEIGDRLASAIRELAETSEGVGFTKGLAEGRRVERAADAELVRAAGCLCFSLALAGDFGGRAEGDLDAAEEWRVDEHDPGCPIALALAIEARGKE